MEAPPVPQKTSKRPSVTSSESSMSNNNAAVTQPKVIPQSRVQQGRPNSTNSSNAAKSVVTQPKNVAPGGTTQITNQRKVSLDSREDKKGAPVAATILQTPPTPALSSDPGEWPVEQVIKHICHVDPSMAVHAEIFRKHVSALS